MKNYFFTRLPDRQSEFKAFVRSRLRLIFFCMVLFCETLPGQVCDKKTTIYFETDQYSIPAAENQKLRKLTRLFAQKTDTFLLEIDAFTDSIASVDYNYKLANNRLKTIVNHLKKNSRCHFEITERVRGEALSPGSNATEEGRSKNRRVDIFYWQLKSGRITLKAKGGTEIDLQKDFFAPCGICESKPEISEVLTNEEAAQQGVSFITTDGDTLVTGGMIDLQFNCPKSKDSPCTDVIIRIPAPSYAEGMEVWRSAKESNARNLKWSRDKNGGLEYDAKDKCYIMRVNYCPGDTELPFRWGCYNYIRGNCQSAFIAAPELTRATKAPYAEAISPGNLIYGRMKLTDVIWGYNHRGEGSIFFADSGMGKNKVGYKFSGIIDRYAAGCGSAIKCPGLMRCRCFEIPLDAYTKIIYFKKKNYRLKVPRKYRDFTPALFIPGADTLLQLTRVQGSARKYTFQLPLPDTYVVVYNEKANPNNKRGYDGQIDLSKVRAKYNKRHKYYKVKLKRKQIKKAISANS